MMRLALGKAGFTLVEVVVGLGVAAALVGTSGPALSGLLRHSIAARVHLQAVQDLRLSTTWLLDDIGQAWSTDLADGAPPSSTAQFTRREGAATVTCGYVLNGDQLQRQCPGGSLVVGRYVSAFALSRSGRLVTVGLTSSPPGNPDAVRSGTLTVYMRGD